METLTDILYTKHIDCLGEKIIWDCLNYLKSYEDFKRLYSLTKKFLEDNYGWLRPIDINNISTILTKGIFSYFRNYSNSNENSPYNLSNYITEFLRRDLFHFITEAESEYIKSLGNSYRGKKRSL
ncbi:MAG: hypothetical protein QXU40_00290 [Candidatus Pacearchaeota archaeon]